MAMLRKLRNILLLVPPLFYLGTAKAEPLVNVDFSGVSVVTSEYPPYNFSGETGAEGIAVERVKQVLEKLNLDLPIAVYPWARAYETAKKVPGTLIFSMARSKERENTFKWVGTIVDFHVNVYRLKSRPDVKVRQFEDIKNYRVGALNKDIKGNYLRSRGISPVIYASEELGIRMLVRGRIDLMPIDANSFDYRINRLGYAKDQFEEVLTLTDISHPLYMAFHKNTPDAVVEAFRASLKEVRPESSVE